MHSKAKEQETKPHSINPSHQRYPQEEQRRYRNECRGNKTNLPCIVTWTEAKETVDHYYEPEEANSNSIHNVVQQQKNSCNSLYNSLLAAPSKVAEQKSCTVNLPAQGSRERVTNTQKHRRRRRRRSSGENKNKTRLLKHTEKKDRQAQERLNLDLRKPPHTKKRKKERKLATTRRNTKKHWATLQH